MSNSAASEPEFVEVYTANRSVEAHVIRNFLLDEGIDAWVLGDQLEISFAGLPLGGHGQPIVVTHPRNVARAKELIQQREAAPPLVEPEDTNHD